MVVQPNEKNFSDQQLLQFALLETFGVTLLRRSLIDIHINASLDESNGMLSYDGRVIPVRGIYLDCAQIGD